MLKREIYKQIDRAEECSVPLFNRSQRRLCDKQWGWRYREWHMTLPKAADKASLSEYMYIYNLKDVDVFLLLPKLLEIGLLLLLPQE